MSYEPTNWKNGDIITAQKLNKLEQGVARPDLLKVQIIGSGAYSLSSSWQDIHDAAVNGLGCIFYRYNQIQKFYYQYTSFQIFQEAQDEDSPYVIIISDFNGGTQFYAESPDGLPETPSEDIH